MTRKSTFILRLISLVICISILVQIPPVGIFAKANASNLSSKSSDGTEGVIADGSLITGELVSGLQDITDEPCEIVSMRTPTEKYIRMPDGSYTVAKYAYDVHYFDGTGYKEYDNSLELKTGLDGESVFSPKSSDVNVAFKQNVAVSGTGEQELFTVGKDNFSIGVFFCGEEELKTTKAVVLAEADTLSLEEMTKAEELTTLVGKRGTVSYESVLPYTSINYTALGNRIKEDIVLNSAMAETSWSFKLETSGVNAEVQSDGSIVFTNVKTDEICCVIPKGYMYDNAGAFSNDVTYTLTETAGGYILNVNADKAWISDTKRVFPVTVDPTFILGGRSQDEISDAYVVEGSPAMTTGAYHILIAGYSQGDSAYLHTRSLFKINTLPKLPASARIVSATLNLQQLESGEWYSYNSASNYIHMVAKKITSSWNESTVCWNSQPSYGSKLHDYVTVTAGTATKLFQLDITSACQEWYENPSANYGVVVQSYNESADGYVGFISSDNTSSVATQPLYTISYRDTKGLDGRWAYSTQDMGNLGCGYVNLFNGNLVYTCNAIQTAGAVIPIEVSQVYNGSTKSWRLSVNEQMEVVDISGVTWIKYTDADGTELYFKDYPDGETGNYLSEDGYALTIKINTSSTSARFVMTDDYGNKKTFNSSGNIVSITDINGNKKEFTYTNNKVSYVKYYPAGSTTAINQLSFTYNAGNGLIERITNCLDTTQYVQFTHGMRADQNNLTITWYVLSQIKYSSGHIIIFDYDEEGYLKKVSNPAGGKYLNYYYNTAKEKVVAVQEGTSSGTGQKVGFSYGNKRTVERNSGLDDVYGNSDDLKNIYLFDNFGRTVCAYTTDADGKEIYGASNAEYNDNLATASPRKNNTLEKSASAGKFIENLVPNSSFENTDAWTIASTATGYSGEIVNTAAYLGLKSVKLTSTAATGKVNCYKTITVEPGETYTLSAYLKTESIVASDAAISGAFIQLGNRSEVYTGSTNTNIQSGWQRISCTYTAGASTTSVKIYLTLANATGTAYFDCIQLEKAETASTYNLISNGGLTKSTEWSASGQGQYYSGAGLSGNGAIKITGVPDSNGFVMQYAQIRRPAKDVAFVLSGWAKADAAASTDRSFQEGNQTYAHKNRDFGLRVILYYSDGMMDSFFVNFNPNIRSKWQYASGAIIPSLARSETNVTRIDVYAYYGNNINSALFDNISLTLEPAVTYTYDEKGNVTEVSQPGGDSQSLAYEGVDVRSQNYASGDAYSYTYYTDSNNNSTHKVKDVTSNTGVKATYAYNTYGNVSGITITPSSGSLVISSSATYAYYGNFPSKVTDARGKSTTYSYDTALGLLDYVTNANSARTAYVYNSGGQLTKLFNDIDKDNACDTGEASVSYSYDYLRRLSTITTATTVYRFSYDYFGNVTAITVGDNTVPLVSYTYASNNGKLIKTTYADGTYVENTYDELDRVVEVKYNGATAYTVCYDSNGAVSSCTETGGREHHYEFDSLGRLIRYRLTNSSGTALVTQNTFDSAGRKILSLADVENGTATLQRRIIYSETNGAVQRIAYAVGTNVVLNYTYDEFDRVKSKAITGSTKPTHEYSYYTSGSKTSTLVSSLAVKLGSNVLNTYGYTYDNVGNIKQITDSTTTWKYTYDSLNRMLSEICYTTATGIGTAVYYTYDESGNILTKKKYTYNSGTLSNQQTVNYTYGDSEWGDLLTSYNGNAITYDANGNPTSYGNGLKTYGFLWSKGNQLQRASINDSSSVAAYYYGSDGLRYCKFLQTDKIRKQYYYQDGLLTAETWSTSASLTFMYDAEGSPIAFKYFNGTTSILYFYVKNLQGDVIEIRDTSGNVVAKYSYDAWGKLLSVTDANGTAITDTTHVGIINPLRYRGYYYDNETGFYYLGSRYYDPEVGRFISADNVISDVGGSIQGYNLFAYCFNNPVNMSDPSGNWPSWGQVFAAVATVAVAAVFVATVVASAGAVGVAAGVAAASIGATGTMVSATITIGTVGTYAVAAGIGACTLSNAGEILTGTNFIRDGLMGGNQEAYDTVQTVLNIAGGGAMIIGQTNPGVTGNAAKPKQNAQSVHKVPTTGKANTSFDKLYAGKAGDFQRTYYDFRGNMSLQIDFTIHNNPLAHSNPHLHTFWLGKRQPQTNLWYLE